MRERKERVKRRKACLLVESLWVLKVLRENGGFVREGDLVEALEVEPTGPWQALCPLGYHRSLTPGQQRHDQRTAGCKNGHTRRASGGLKMSSLRVWATSVNQSFDDLAVEGGNRQRLFPCYVNEAAEFHPTGK